MIRQRFGYHRSRCERARFERKSGDTADKSAVARRKKKKNAKINIEILKLSPDLEKILSYQKFEF